MRKIYTTIIIIFILTSTVIFVFFDKNYLDYLSILTISQDRQRLITDSELLSITMYLSSEDTFVVDSSLVTGSYLVTETEEIEVGINSIRKLDYEEEFQFTDYYAYCIDLDFNSITIDNYRLELENVFLKMNYLNQETVYLELGNLYLEFKEIDNQNFIDMNRMYTTYYPNTNFMSGLVISLNNSTGFDISIDSIDILNPNVDLDLANLVILETGPTYNEEIANILNTEYNPIGEITNEYSYILEKETLLFIPFKYHVQLIELGRFPVEINYTYNQTSYIYLIDDFLFNSQTLSLEENNGRIREFIYNY